MSESRRVLCLVPSRELFDKLEPLFSRDTLDITTVPSGKGALVLLRNLAFDLIVTEHPLPDLAPEELLAAIRDPDAGNARTPVLVFTREPPAALTSRLPDDPELTCRSLAADDTELLAVIAGRLGTAARRDSRLLVQLDVEMGPGRILRACQTVNISESGMLLRTKRLLPLATDVELAFSLPASRHAIQASGRIVRHASREGDGHAGLGIRFTQLAEGDREALAEFLSELSKADGSAAAAIPRAG